MCNQWKYFPITVQGAVAICKKEGLDFQSIHNSTCYGMEYQDFCLATGAKISWNRMYGYVVYGYRFDSGDTLPYRKYVNKKFQPISSGGWELKSAT